MLVAIPSPDCWNSLNVRKPRTIRSRMISSDQRSPKISSDTLTGQPDRRLDFALSGTLDRIRITCRMQVNFQGLRGPLRNQIRSGGRNGLPAWKGRRRRNESIVASRKRFRRTVLSAGAETGNGVYRLPLAVATWFYCRNAKLNSAFPAATATYCLPPARYVMGPEATAPPRFAFHSTAPVRASSA